MFPNMSSYTPVHCMIIVLKDTTSYRVVKRITPSLSLLNGPLLKIRKRTTLTPRIDKVFTPCCPFLHGWITVDNKLPGGNYCTSHCKNMSRQFSCDIVQLELFVARLFKSTC